MTIQNIKVEDYNVGPINITGWRFACPREISAETEGDETMEELAMAVEEFIAKVDSENIDNNSPCHAGFYPECMTKNYATSYTPAIVISFILIVGETIPPPTSLGSFAIASIFFSISFILLAIVTPATGSVNLPPFIQTLKPEAISNSLSVTPGMVWIAIQWNVYSTPSLQLKR